MSEAHVDYFFMEKYRVSSRGGLLYFNVCQSTN